MGRVRDRSLHLLLALALAHGLLYAVLLPPWQAPDETGHFEYAWLLANQGWLPDREHLSPAFEQELLASLYTWRFGDFIGRPLPQIMPDRLEKLPQNSFARMSRPIMDGRFSLAYLWQALFLLPVRGQELTLQLFAARLSSVLLSVGIVWLAYRTFVEILAGRDRFAPLTTGTGQHRGGRRRLVFVMTLVIILLPQHTHINSSVGDGTLAELMACLVLYGWVRLFRRGASAVPAIAIVLGTAVAVLTKATAAFLVPLDVGLGIWWFVQSRRLGEETQHNAGRKSPRPGLRVRRLIIVCAALIALASAAALWSQSGLGRMVLRAIESRLAASHFISIDWRGITLGQALLFSHDSFWAWFGWMSVPIGQRWYGVLLMLTLTACLGWLVPPHERSEGDLPGWAVAMMGAAFLSALAAFLWVGILAPLQGTYQYQGRYLFAAAVPFAFLLVGGFARIWSSRQRLGLFALTGFLVVVDVWSILVYIIPFFYYR